MSLKVAYSSESLGKILFAPKISNLPWKKPCKI